MQGWVLYFIFVCAGLLLAVLLAVYLLKALKSLSGDSSRRKKVRRK